MEVVMNMKHSLKSGQKWKTPIIIFCVVVLSIITLCGFCKETTVLLVDDFPSAEFDWKALWKSDLDEINVTYEIVTPEKVNMPTRVGKARLEEYDIVIWHTGIEEEDTLTHEERAAIVELLENGGNLFIVGTSIPKEMIDSGNRKWLQRYLRCDFLMPNSPIIDGSVYDLEPVVGCEGSIFDGVSFEIDHGQFDTYAANNLNLVYEDVDPVAGGGGAVHSIRFRDITGNLGVLFEGSILPGAPPCRLLFLTFPPETAHPQSARKDIIKRALGFFTTPHKPRHAIKGRVVVDTQAQPPVEGAIVSIPGTTYRTYSHSDGSFVLCGVPPGSYDINVSLFRYNDMTKKSVKIPQPGKEPVVLKIKKAKEPLVEGRGIWVIRNEMTSPEKIKRMVDQCAAAGINAIYAQVRGRGDAYYKSATEPRAESLEGQPDDFDPLGYLIELARKKNMEVHAWMNAGYSYEGRNPKEPYSKKHILARHPEWSLMNRAGKSLLDYTPQELRAHHNEGIFLSLCVPECREYLTDVFLEVVKNYDVDGVHFDFIRFPFSGRSFDDPWALGFSPLTRSAFKEEHGIDPLDIDPKDGEKVKLYNDWRRLCVSRLVEAVTKGAHMIKPDVRVSAAVLHRYHLARESHCYQDWLEWLKNGKIDTCCVMAYGNDNSYIEKIIRMATENTGQGTIWAGLSGNWRGDRENGIFDSVMDRVEMVRRYKPEGVMFFAYKHFDDNEIEGLKKSAFDVPATVPALKK
jgi:uncharacterized lipoprotein YddW (UPF0748 family)